MALYDENLDALVEGFPGLLETKDPSRLCIRLLVAAPLDAPLDIIFHIARIQPHCFCLEYRVDRSGGVWMNTLIGRYCRAMLLVVVKHIYSMYLRLTSQIAIVMPPEDELCKLPSHFSIHSY